MSLRVAIVGCGAVAQRLYAKPLRLLERRRLIQVIALVDPVDAHAAAMGRVFPQAKHHSGLEPALASAAIDLTLVLSPAHLHCAQTLQALSHRSHVLCEKPMASTEADCIRMNEAAGRAGRVLAVGMIRRFFPAYGELRGLVTEGALGQVRGFEYREGHKFEWDVTTPAAFKPRREGGTGVLFDIGPHALDALAWILGDVRVNAYADDALEGIESNCALDVTTLHGGGPVFLSWDAPQANELRVYGDRAEAVLRIDRFDHLAVGRAGAFSPVPITTSFAADLSPAGGARLRPTSYPDAIYCQVVQVLRAIQHAEAPAADGEDGRRSVATLEAAIALATPLPMPWLSSNEQREFHDRHWSLRS